jgi:hypothetical protein
LIPGPDERLRELLSPLPDLCRAIVAAVERQQRLGGGEVPILLQVGPQGLEGGIVSIRYHLTTVR